MPGWRVLDADEAAAAVEELAVQASVRLPEDVEAALETALRRESRPTARYALSMILENARVAASRHMPLCQDTGMFHLFVELGEGTALPAGFQEAVDRGLRRATSRVPLRSSLVDRPLGERRDRGDNTPVSVHVRSGGAAGKIRFTLLAKGGGSENATRLCMLLPSAGKDGVTRAVMEAVRARAAHACPPVVVGVGVGADAAGALTLALQSLLRPLGSRNGRRELAELEEELLALINGTGIGAAGLGGDVTALDVHLEEAPTHMACLPVGVVIACHSLRRSSRNL